MFFDKLVLMWSSHGVCYWYLQARFLTHRERIIARGIAADAHQPEWCHQNEGLCYLKKKE